MWDIVEGVAELLLDGVLLCLSQEEEKSCSEWHKSYKEVQKNVYYHNRRLSEHLQRSAEYCEYKSLVSEHHLAVKAGQLAHDTYAKGKASVKAMNRVLCEVKKRLDTLFKDKHATDSVEEKRAIQLEINRVIAARKEIFHARDKAWAESEKFLESLRTLNNRTCSLKGKIRDTTGQPGKDWYTRLEERTRQRNVFSAL